MSLRCVEMLLFPSVKLSSFCLFSYTFRLRSSFINIFFRARPPEPLFPSAATIKPPLRRIICPAFSASVWAFVLSSGQPAGGAALPTHPQGKPEPRCLVNIILGGFPTGRKRFYNSRRLFPTYRKWAARLAGVGDKSLRWQGTPDTSMVRPFERSRWAADASRACS
jgi:hypothetical protein